MTTLYALTERERNLLREMLAEFSQRRHNTTLRGGRLEADHQGPETYVALVPEGGIPALSGNVPGSAECEIWQVGADGTLDETLTASRTVYNLSSSDLTAGEYLAVHRDKFGSWLTGTSGAGSGGSGDDVMATLTQAGDVSLVDQALGDGNKTFNKAVYVNYGQTDSYVTGVSYLWVRDAAGLPANLLCSHNQVQVCTQDGAITTTSGSIYPGLLVGLGPSGCAAGFLGLIYIRGGPQGIGYIEVAGGSGAGSGFIITQAKFTISASAHLSEDDLDLGIHRVTLAIKSQGTDEVSGTGKGASCELFADITGSEFDYGLITPFYSIKRSDGTLYEGAGGDTGGNSFVGGLYVGPGTPVPPSSIQPAQAMSWMGF